MARPSALLSLFNLLPGPDGDGGTRRVLPPLPPESIGCADGWERIERGLAILVEEVRRTRDGG